MYKEFDYKAEYQERQEAYERYVTDVDIPVFITDIKVPRHANGFILQTAIGLNCIWLFCGFFSGDVYQFMRDVYSPISNGHIKRQQISHDINGNDIYQYDPSYIGKFNPTTEWVANAAAAFVALCIAIGLEHKHNKAKRALYKEHDEYNREVSEIQKQQKNEKMTVDVMLNLKKFGFHYHINKEDAENLVYSVIKDMVREQQVYFKLLMDANVDIENEEAVKNIATIIISEHLRNHRDDLLEITDKFGPEIVPNDILEKYINKGPENQRE